MKGKKRWLIALVLGLTAAATAAVPALAPLRDVVAVVIAEAIRDTETQPLDGEQARPVEPDHAKS